MGGTKSIRDWAALCAQEFTLTFADGSTETVWIRTRTQTEIEAARDAVAVVRLATKRKYAPGTDYYEALTVELEFMPTPDIAELIAGAEIASIMRQAHRALPALMPLDPGNYQTDAERLKAEDEQDKREAERAGLVRAKVEELTAKRRAELEAMEHDAVVQMAARFSIERLIMEAAQEEMVTRWLFDAVRMADDHSLPYFGMLDGVPQQMAIRDSFLTVVQTVDAISPVDIKNSPGRFGTPTVPAASTPEATPESSTPDSPARSSRRTSTRGGRTES